MNIKHKFELKFYLAIIYGPLVINNKLCWTIHNMISFNSKDQVKLHGIINKVSIHFATKPTTSKPEICLFVMKAGIIPNEFDIIEYKQLEGIMQKTGIQTFTGLNIPIDKGQYLGIRFSFEAGSPIILEGDQYCSYFDLRPHLARKIPFTISPFNIIPEFDEIVQFWINNENLKTNQTSLGLMMIQTGQLNEAKKYYESLIKYLPDNHPLEKYCKYGLGNIAQKKGEIDDAEKYYNEAFENQVDTLLRARVICALANIYFSMNDESKALEYYKLALSMFNKNHKDSMLDIIECHTDIGKYYGTSQIDKDYGKALKSFTNAINELDNWVSKNIRKQWRYVLFIIIPLLKNIGEMFRLKHEFNKAYACQYTILLICKKFSMSNDSQVGSIYEEIGRIYQEDKKLKLALTFYHKAADIYYWGYSQTSNHNINIQKLIQDNINQM
ncbi:unnamed protein product, partial [Rotaria sordida]